jgi:hypothetical protein
MVWYPANTAERAMAWALSTGNYTRYFRAFTRTDLFLPSREGGDPDGLGEPITAEVAGHTVLPVFTSDEGLLAVYAAQPPEVIVVTRYEDLRDGWPSPQWRLAINPGLPIEAYLPVELVELAVRDELSPFDPRLLIGRLGNLEWEPWPPGGPQQALLDAVERSDGAEYLDALRDCMVILPTTRPVSAVEVDEFSTVKLHHRGPGPVDEPTRDLLARLGVRPEAVDREFPWRFATGRPVPTVEIFTQPEFRPDPEAPSVRMRFLPMLNLIPAGYALSVNPGGPGWLELPSEDLPLLREWDGLSPVPLPLLRGMRWAPPVPIIERRDGGDDRTEAAGAATASRRWQPFEPGQLGRGSIRAPWQSPGEQVCPACGVRALRQFVHSGDRFGRPILFAYTWCAHCRRYHGTTGPRPEGLQFTEPVSRLEIDATDGLSGLLDLLDRRWNEGTLPQSFRMSGDGDR